MEIKRSVACPLAHYIPYVLKPIEGDIDNMLLILEPEVLKKYDVWHYNPSGFSEHRDSFYDKGIGKYWSEEHQGYLISKYKTGHHSVRWVLDSGAMLWHDNPPTNLFQGFTINRYGKGYCLIPPHGHIHEGVKYYYYAWWQAKNNWWFFRKEFQRDFFIQHGAIFNILQCIQESNAKEKIEYTDNGKPFRDLSEYGIVDDMEGMTIN